ncbi:MAG: hypothetical protein FWD05_09455 [Oscillospiraceae bacterium]|nr:hypothetical protein [Oscillospiraceae bacterium]
MSLDFTPSQVSAELTAQNLILGQILEQAPLLLSDIEAYNNENMLQGRAFTAHKKYKDQAHGDYLRKLIQGYTSFQGANDYHIQALNSFSRPDSRHCSVQIDNEITYLNNRISNIDWWRNAFSWWNDVATVIDHFTWETREILAGRRQIQLDKQADLQSYESATMGIYDEAVQYINEAERLLNRIEFAERCLTSGYVTLLSIDKVSELIALGVTPEERAFLLILQKQFGFDDETIRIMQQVKIALRQQYPSASQMDLDWRFMRLMGGFVYDDDVFHIRFAWDQTAGVAIDQWTLDPTGRDRLMNELEFFRDFLGISEADFNRLRYSVRVQHQIVSGSALREPPPQLFDSYMRNMARALGREWDVTNTHHRNEFLQLWHVQFDRKSDTGDFAHMQITFATHLATDLGVAGRLPGIALGGRTRVEWMAGWLGDATQGNPPSFPPDDFIANLDAANIAHIMRNNPDLSLADATNQYFNRVGPEFTRAQMFITHTPLETVRAEIFSELENRLIAGYISSHSDSCFSPSSREIIAFLSDKDAVMSVLQEVSRDTYLFIRSLESPEDHHEMMWPN